MKNYDLKPKKSNNEDVISNTIINKSSILFTAILALIVCLLISGCWGAGGSDDSSGDTAETSSASKASGPIMPMNFNGTKKIDSDSSDFTVVVLPDPQNYSHYYPDTYYAQTNWIVQNASTENIKFVIHLGDFVEDSTIDQWGVADTAHDILDKNSIPYSVAIGNHDYEIDNDPERDSTKFNQYFGVSRFSGKSWYGGGYPSGKNDNSYYFFESDDLNFLVISLEYAPRKDTLAWAADIVNSYPDHRVIIVTHGYLWSTDYSPQHANLTTYYDLIGSDGTTMFNEFISRYSNIFMVIAGHCGGDSVRSVTANDGHTIYEVLVDYQYEPNGGNGWFKTMEFSPSDGTILMTPQTVASNVSTFSKTAYYPSDPEDHIFNVSYNMSAVSDFAEVINPVGFNDRIINSIDSGNQRSPKIVNTPSGYSVTAWEDDSDDDGKYNVKIRGFTPDGTESFEETTVNSNTSGTHINPSIAADSSGNVVVVWQDDSNGDGYYDIKVSGYTIDGTCRFSNYTVNTDSNGQHVNPAVAIDSTGKFITVWQDDSDDNGNYMIYMRAFDATGSEYFSQREVNSASTGNFLNPDVDVLSTGNFVIVWENNRGSNSSHKIYMRGFNFTDSAQEYFTERNVNSGSSGQQSAPAVCKLDSGDFVVAWEDDNDSNGYFETYISGFDSTGSQYFIQKAASSSGEGQQYNPAIASDEDGNFAVTWQDGLKGAYHIMTRAFNRSAAEILAQTIVNKDDSGQQTAPDVTIGNEGRIVIAWMDDTDNDGYNKIVGRGAYDFSFEIYYGD